MCCREKLRQLELPTKLASKPINTFLGSISSSNGSRPGTPSQTGRLTAAASDEVQMALNQDLVAAMVKLDGMNRRLEMVEREKERINASTLDAQVCTIVLLCIVCLLLYPASCKN